MKNLAENIFQSIFCRDRWLVGASVLSLFANAIIWLLIFFNWDVIHEEGREYIILHYKVFYGPDFYSNWYFVFAAPLAGMLFGILNVFLGKIAYPFARIISYFLGIVSLACQLLLIVGTYLIVRINIF